MPLTVFDNVAGSANYRIATKAAVTVMMWRGEKKVVRVNHARPKPPSTRYETGRTLRRPSYFAATGCWASLSRRNLPGAEPFCAAVM